MKRIEIFKPGRHTAMSGATIDFTEADLQATAAAYDPKLHEAPIVVGHPKLDAPAYGWAKALTYAGALEAEPDQVDPAFADLVNAGRFKKISASFFLPNAPGNPKPGVYYLRHIGFLGATPPAVKGLKSASFAGSEDGVIEFGDWSDTMQARVLRRLRDWLIGKFGNDEADKAINPYDVEEIERMAHEPPKTVPGVSYSEPPKETSMTLTPEQIQALQAENAALKSAADEAKKKTTEFAEREARLNAAEIAAQHKEHAEFAESLVKAGKILPRDRDGLVAFMDALDADAVIEFGEGDAKQSPAAMKWLGDFLSRLPKQVDYNEHAKPGAEGDKTASFAAPHGYAVDTTRLDLHQKALAHQAAHPNVSYEAALAAVAG